MNGFHIPSSTCSTYGGPALDRQALAETSLNETKSRKGMKTKECFMTILGKPLGLQRIVILA